MTTRRFSSGRGFLTAVAAFVMAAGLAVQIVNAQGSNGQLVTIAPGAAQGEASAPIPFGIVRMPDDPERRSVQAAAQAVRNMTYHGGPVQHVQRVFTIFWNPTTTPFPAGYQATNNQFVQDLDGSSYYAIASQYADTTSQISTTLTFGGTWLDTDTANPIPHNPPTSLDVSNEVNRAIAVNGWTADANSYFQVFTPSGYTSTNFCGWHSWSSRPYGLVLFPSAGGCDSPAPFPNDFFADTAITVSAHEIMETLTDPQGTGWYFVDGSGEIGDLCAWNFGARAGDGSNVTLNGHKYLIQQEWSNAAYGCVMSPSQPAQAIITSPAPGTTLGPNVTFTWSSGVGVTYYDLNIGSTPGGRDLFDAVDGVFTTISVTGLPIDGRPLYVTLWSWIAPSWYAYYYQYAASTLPLFTLQPANQIIPVGQTATFTAAASGTTPSFNWQISTNGGGTWSNLQNSGPYGGVTTPILTVSGATKVLNGAQFRCVATNVAGSGTSNAATLTVRSASVLTTDFDSDGKADPAVYRPFSGIWYILQSSTNYASYIARSWGVSTDIPVPGDYDGDSKPDIAVYRPSTGTWWVLKSSTNFTASSAYQWGVSTDIPVSGDFDGDGKTDIAVYRPSSGTWWVLKSSTNFTASSAYQWGVSTDIPVSGDFDGDGITDIAVYRPSTGTWWILESSTNFTSYLAQPWGESTDIPVSGDFDGDGKTDIAIYRPSTGTWWILQSSTNFTSYVSKSWGVSTDIPVPGDFDGDGKTDIAVYRPSTGTWWILKSSTNFTVSAAYQWGLPNDTPVLKPAAMELPLHSCSEEGTLKSISGTAPSQLHFYNQSGATRQVYWLDYTGQPQLWFTLNVGSDTLQDSYATHAWLATDSVGVCKGIFVAASQPSNVILR